MWSIFCDIMSHQFRHSAFPKQPPKHHPETTPETRYETTPETTAPRPGRFLACHIKGLAWFCTLVTIYLIFLPISLPLFAHVHGLCHCFAHSAVTLCCFVLFASFALPFFLFSYPHPSLLFSFVFIFHVLPPLLIDGHPSSPYNMFNFIYHMVSNPHKAH
jgi:hypothetical protein